MIDIHKLEDDLEKLPFRIYTQEKVVIDAKEDLEMAKMELKIKIAAVMLNSKRPNATEKKAEADVNSKKEQEIVLAKAIEFEKQQAYLTALNNKFVALRKITGIETELMKTKVLT